MPREIRSATTGRSPAGSVELSTPRTSLSHMTAPTWSACDGLQLRPPSVGSAAARALAFGQSKGWFRARLVRDARPYRRRCPPCRWRFGAWGWTSPLACSGGVILPLVRSLASGHDAFLGCYRHTVRREAEGRGDKRPPRSDHLDRHGQGRLGVGRSGGRSPSALGRTGLPPRRHRSPRSLERGGVLQSPRHGAIHGQVIHHQIVWTIFGWWLHNGRRIRITRVDL